MSNSEKQRETKEQKKQRELVATLEQARHGDRAAMAQLVSYSTPEAQAAIAAGEAAIEAEKARMAAILAGCTKLIGGGAVLAAAGVSLASTAAQIPGASPPVPRSQEMIAQIANAGFSKDV